MKKSIVIVRLLFAICIIYNMNVVHASTSVAYCTDSYDVSSLYSRAHGRNWVTFLEWNYPRGVWRDQGLNSAYDVGMDTYWFKILVGELSSTWTTSEESISRLYSLIGFSRANTVLNLKESRFIKMISCDEVSFEQQKALESCVNILINKYRAPLDLAQKFSLITVFEVSWNDAVSLMTHICPEGAFSHEYSVEEALFIIHMKAKSPSVFEKSFWSSTKYNDEQLLYAKCLVGALAKVLKIEGTISEDFGFSIGTNHDPKTLLFENAIRFLSAYSEGNPEFSKKPPAGVDIPVVYQ